MSKLIIKKSGIIFAMFILLAVLEYHFFYLYKLDNIINIIFNKNSRVGIGFLSLFIWMFSCTYKTNKFIEHFCKYVVFAFIVFLGYSCLICKEQTFYNALESTAHILCLLLVKPLYIVFKQQGTIHKVLKVVNIVAIVWYIVVILQNIAFKNNGQMILQQFFSNSHIYISEGRSENVRMTLISLGNIVPLYNLYNLLQMRDRRCQRRFGNIVFNVSSLVLGCYCIIFIAQTRAYMLAVVGAVIMMFLKETSNSRRIIYNVYFIFAGIIVLYVTGVLDSFLNTFSMDSSNTLAYSTYMRFYEYKECLKYFIENPLVGHGMLIGTNYDLVYSSSVLPGAIIYTSDVGIVGLLGGSGIIGLVLFMWPFIRMIKQYWVLANCGENISWLLVGFITYLILTSVSLMITDYERIFAFPIMIAISEYYYWKSTEIRKTLIKGEHL